MRRRRKVAAARSDTQRAILHVDTDRVPLAVPMSGAWITERILTAQFVGNAGRRGIEIASVPHDFGAATAIVGDVSQRGSVHAVATKARAARIFRRFGGWNTRRPGVAWSRHARQRWSARWRARKRKRKVQRAAALREEASAWRVPRRRG